MDIFESRLALYTKLPGLRCLIHVGREGNGTLHYPDCDESGNRLVQDLTRNELASLPPHAVLFTAQWDYGLAAGYYFQEVEGLRRDVVVVSPELLRYGWYVDELAHRAPALVNDARPEAEAFRAALRPFENHESYDASAIGAAYRAFTDSLAARAMRRRPVLCTRETARVLGGPWNMVPRGLAIELRLDTTYVADAPTRYHFEPWLGHMDAYVATTHWIYADALVQRASYERDHGRARTAEQYLALAARFDPNIRLDRVPPLALDGNALVTQSAGFFQNLARQPGRGSSVEH